MQFLLDVTLVDSLPLLYLGVDWSQNREKRLQVTKKKKQKTENSPRKAILFHLWLLMCSQLVDPLPNFFLEIF